MIDISVFYLAAMVFHGIITWTAFDNLMNDFKTKDKENVFNILCIISGLFFLFLYYEITIRDWGLKVDTWYDARWAIYNYLNGMIIMMFLKSKTLNGKYTR